MPNDFYTVHIGGPRPALYRVIRGGRVLKWQPLSQAWKPSVLYSTEEKLMRAGAVTLKAKHPLEAVRKIF